MRKTNRPVVSSSGSILTVVSLMAAFSAVTYGEDEAAEAGQQLFLAQKCNTCHAVSTVGIEAKAKSESMRGPDLINLAGERTPEWLAQYLRKEIQLDDADHKREFKGTPEELDSMVSWLLEQEQSE